MWERGIRESALARRPLGLWLVVAVAVAALALVTALSGRDANSARGLGFGTAPDAPEAADTPQAAEPDEPQDTGEPHDTGEPQDAGEPQDTGEPTGELEPGATGGDEPVALRPEHLYTLDGTDPEAFPGQAAGLAFLDLEDPASEAYREFGPPQAQQPDINDATANVWSLAGEAEFVAVTAGGEPEDPVVGLMADVPEGSLVRFAAHGGVVIGRSTPAEIAEAWGSGYDRSDDERDDYVLRYTLCHGPWPVVVKFDQPEERSWTDAPVTSVLIAYTDDDPATAGCPAA